MAPNVIVNLSDLARWYADRPSAWPAVPRFDPVRRWYARIGADGDHEAWLLTFLPGQETSLHDHGGAAGAFTVLAGTLSEDVHLGEGGQWTAGQTAEFGTGHVHRLVNAGHEPVLSLHVYAPRLTTMTRYEYTADGSLRVLAVEREGENW